VFAGHAGGPKSTESAGAAGKAGEYKAASRPPHSEREFFLDMECGDWSPL